MTPATVEEIDRMVERLRELPSRYVGKLGVEAASLLASLRAQQGELERALRLVTDQLAYECLADEGLADFPLNHKVRVAIETARALLAKLPKG